MHTWNPDIDKLNKSVKKIDEFKYLDRDNIDDSPQSAESYALRSPLGEVATSNLKKSICVYTDGSCRNNGKKNAIAGIGVYIENICKISEPIVGRQTNQRAELFAILKALQIINISI